MSGPIPSIFATCNPTEFETHSGQVVVVQEGFSVEISQFLLQEPWKPRIHLASLQWFCPSWALLSDSRLSWSQSQTSAKLDPDVLKQCLESALIPFMPLLLKILYGLTIFLRSAHWIYHHHVDRAPWTTLLETNQPFSPGDSVKKTPTLSQASPAGCYVTPLQVWCLPSSVLHSAGKIWLPYLLLSISPFIQFSLFAFYHVCERVLGLFCSGRDDGSKCVMVKRQRGVSLLRFWTNPVHVSILRMGGGVGGSIPKPDLCFMSPCGK